MKVIDKPENKSKEKCINISTDMPDKDTYNLNSTHEQETPLSHQFKLKNHIDCFTCDVSCLFEKIKRSDCGKLILSTENKTISHSVNDTAIEKDIAPLFELLNESKNPVYTMIAPAFSGQFSSNVTSGKLRSAFKSLGFYGMVEVALFADILTLKEALEFERYIKTKDDFILTSCCCPMWVGLIRKNYSTLIPHIPPSVSPMVACGRSIKKLHPDAKTVFIGPCYAKKAEAKMPDVKDAVDFVLTFDEVIKLFNLKHIDPVTLTEDVKDHSSRAGRIYARTSGVSEAVEETLKRLNPNKKIKFIAAQANGITECKNLLKEILEGSVHANFIEGMGCVGGCVGGPKSLLNHEEAAKHVNSYGDEAIYKTPVDNKYVLDMLQRLGFDTIESLLDRDNIFTRKF